eukprot:gene7724-biopygen4839
METPHSIDFTMDEKGRNVCISICKYAHTPQEAEALLKPVVKRIAENRPGDKVDWEQRNHLGYNFFSYAAEFDLLHVVWPIVKPLPYFQRQVKPLTIVCKVTLEDWNQLPEEDMKRFEPVGGFVSANFRIRSDQVLFDCGKRFVRRAPEVEWKKLREIGRGTFGVVYLGQLINGELFAVKVSHLKNGGGGRVKVQFEQAPEHGDGGDGDYGAPSPQTYYHLLWNTDGEERCGRRAGPD